MAESEKYDYIPLLRLVAPFESPNQQIGVDLMFAWLTKALIVGQVFQVGDDWSVQASIKGVLA